MGRGSSQPSSAVATLRVLPAGRTAEAVDRQPALDPVVDRLWMSHRAELERVVERLGKAHRLGMPQLAALVGRLHALGGEVGLPPHWKLIAREHPGLGERLHATFIHHPAASGVATSRSSVLEDIFDGSLIDGMVEARYLGRQFCELASWLREHTDVLAAQSTAALARA